MVTLETRQDALLVQKHFVALFHPKPNECLCFDLESCNLMCTYTVVTHPCHISPLAQARPMMLCIYTSIYKSPVGITRTGLAHARPNYLEYSYQEYWYLIGQYQVTKSHRDSRESIYDRYFP